MVLTGIYEHTIDAKHRLAVPSEVRKQLRSEQGSEDAEEIVLFATLDQGRQAICLWPRSRFEQRASELDQSQRPASEILPYERMFYAMAAQVEMDKQGRVRLPERLLGQSGLGTEVTVIGVNDHLEVWRREAWDAYMAQMLEQNPWVLMHPREAMRSEAAGKADQGPA
ncbi:MAG: hypothetical protein IT440_03400 [Phycisphaeraceae bacterium]|nr:hypothetical protein [Phycisphaeraceae bacterium]